jgi:hypothetical protein
MIVLQAAVLVAGVLSSRVLVLVVGIPADFRRRTNLGRRGMDDERVLSTCEYGGT